MRLFHSAVLLSATPHLILIVHYANLLTVSPCHHVGGTQSNRGGTRVYVHVRMKSSIKGVSIN